MLAERGQLRRVARIAENEIVSFVHEHDFIVVDVFRAPWMLHLEERTQRSPVCVKAHMVATSTRVPQRPQRRRWEGLPGMLLGEGLLTARFELAFPIRPSHFQHLAHRLCQLPHLCFEQQGEIPGVLAPQLPCSDTGGQKCTAGADATVVISIPGGPSQELRVEVPAHRLLRKNGHLRPRVVEQTIQHHDHLAGLAGTRGVIDKDAFYRRGVVQQECDDVLVQLHRQANTLPSGG
mmetsp:Transcript_7587/g.27826  ORF Transcript_7587/g.27826 Transcript_7587/m.27826 type:complete len:235 (-) Transcript_7587:763-1467(-)